MLAMDLKLRLASTTEVESELARVVEFYGNNTSKYVRERSPEILRNAISRAAVVLLEDKQGQLLGSCVQIDHGDGRYSETGGVRVLINGFGLQSIMMGICALNEYLFAPPEGFVFAITSNDNYASIKNIGRSGFTTHTPDSAALQVLGYQSEFPPEKLFFKFDWEDTLEIRRKLVAIATSGVLPGRTSSVRILIDHPLFRPENLKMLKPR